MEQPKVSQVRGLGLGKGFFLQLSEALLALPFRQVSVWLDLRSHIKPASSFILTILSGFFFFFFLTKSEHEQLLLDLHKS